MKYNKNEFGQFLTHLLDNKQMKDITKIKVLSSLAQSEMISPFDIVDEQPLIISIFNEENPKFFNSFIKEMNINLAEEGINGKDSLNFVATYILANKYDYSDEFLIQFFQQLKKDYKIDLHKPYVKNKKHYINFQNETSCRDLYPKVETGMNMFEIALCNGSFSLATLLKKKYNFKLTHKELKKTIFNAYLTTHFTEQFQENRNFKKNNYVGDIHFQQNLDMLLSLDLNFNSFYALHLDEHTFINLKDKKSFDPAKCFHNTNPLNVQEDVFMPVSHLKNILYAIKDYYSSDTFNYILNLNRNNFPENFKIAFTELDQQELLKITKSDDFKPKITKRL